MRRWLLRVREARFTRTVTWIALGLVLIYGAILRVDGIAAQQGPVRSPRWLAAWQTRTFLKPESIRPSTFIWEREPVHVHRDGPPTYYAGDPYTYLEDARQMTSFYAAHFREPVFPFGTRLMLWALKNQDVAVSFASAVFSVLAVWFTYLLGAALRSRPVGLLAALGIAIDHDVVSVATLGWRDDAYMAAVALCAYAMLRFRRSEQGPAAMRNAVWLGVASGVAVLTRFMALSFLAAGFAWLLITGSKSWKTRALRLAGAGLVAAVVAAPYFINCWRVYGDPLYTFNVHGSIYGGAEGTQWKGSTAGYVLQKLGSAPIQTIDIVAQGMTTYPFLNKWHGLDDWVEGAGRWVAMASIAGLLLLAGSAAGRLLIVAMIGALAPFSLTWTVDPHFRFTEFLYPFLMIAAAVAAADLCQLIQVLVTRRAVEAGRWRIDSWPAVLVGVVLLSATLWFVMRVSPVWVFRETVRAGETGMITAGVRDRSFLKGNWSAVVPGDINMRVLRGAGAIELPLPSAGDYVAHVRMDPFPRPPEPATGPLPFVDFSLNGRPLTSVELQLTPGRVGSYDIALPGTLVTAGTNRLDVRLRAASGPASATDGDAISLWYVRVDRQH